MRRSSSSWDAGALPVEDDAFDVVLSAFGVIFAPDPEQAAAELLRVLRPGGRLALTTWVPAGPIHDVGRVLSPRCPRDPGTAPGGARPDGCRTS